MTLSSRDEWPDFRVTIHPFPWTWRLRPSFYVDDVDGWQGITNFRWLFLSLEWYGNKPMFTVRNPPELPQSGRADG
jgi:hypothetical protein